MATKSKLANAKPFLKWAGGKTQLINVIEEKIPFKQNAKFNYIEPFVGSGAVFFWILSKYPNIKKAVINDVNADLINSYRTIRDNVSYLIDLLKTYELEYNACEFGSDKRKEYFYTKRAEFNTRTKDETSQTALFIFLNRTCFNGLYRVNRNNSFNVPQGSYKKPQICNSENLQAVSHLLQKVEILNTDYTETQKYAGENSLFYFDPPYKPISKTSSFNSYAKDNFNDDEQKRLKLFCDQLHMSGSNWILSNSDVKSANPDDIFFDVLYADYHINRVYAKRSINSVPEKRGLLSELLITNF